MFKKILLLYLIAGGVCLADYNLEIMLAQVDLDTAAKKATAGNGKRLLDAKTIMIGDRKVHIIKVLAKGGRVRSIRIDAETGKLLDKGKK